MMVVYGLVGDIVAGLRAFRCIDLGPLVLSAWH